MLVRINCAVMSVCSLCSRMRLQAVALATWMGSMSVGMAVSIVSDCHLYPAEFRRRRCLW